ncbi:YfjI family protein [Desulfocicer niacini]
MITRKSDKTRITEYQENYCKIWENAKEGMEIKKNTEKSIRKYEDGELLTNLFRSKGFSGKVNKAFRYLRKPLSYFDDEKNLDENEVLNNVIAKLQTHDDILIGYAFFYKWKKNAANKCTGMTKEIIKKFPSFEEFKIGTIHINAPSDTRRDRPIFYDKSQAEPRNMEKLVLCKETFSAIKIHETYATSVWAYLKEEIIYEMKIPNVHHLEIWIDRDDQENVDIEKICENFENSCQRLNIVRYSGLAEDPEWETMFGEPVESEYLAHKEELVVCAGSDVRDAIAEKYETEDIFVVSKDSILFEEPRVPSAHHLEIWIERTEYEKHCHSQDDESASETIFNGLEEHYKKFCEDLEIILYSGLAENPEWYTYDETELKLGMNAKEALVVCSKYDVRDAIAKKYGCSDALIVINDKSLFEQPEIPGAYHLEVWIDRTEYEGYCQSEDGQNGSESIPDELVNHYKQFCTDLEIVLYSGLAEEPKWHIYDDTETLNEIYGPTDAEDELLDEDPEELHEKESDEQEDGDSEDPEYVEDDESLINDEYIEMSFDDIMTTEYQEESELSFTPLTLENPPTPFPIEALPTWLKEFVKAGSHSIQVPLDAVAMQVLACLAVASQRKFEIRLKDNYEETLSIYIITVMRPGTRKSAAFKLTCKPITDHDVRHYEIFKKSLSAKENELERIEMMRKKAEKKYLEAIGTDEERSLKEVADKLFTEKEACKRATKEPPRLLVDDITPESFTTELYNNNGKLACLAPEGDFVNNLTSNRYSSGPNYSNLLKASGGETIQVNRKDRTEFIARPAFTFGLYFQPALLKKTFANPEVRGRGLWGRIFFCIPKDTLGHRIANPASIPKEIHETYNYNILKLLKLKDNEESEPKLITLSKNSGKQWDDFFVAVEKTMRETGKYSHMTDWVGKLNGHTSKIVALLHLAENVDTTDGWKQPVNAATMRNAIKIGKYLLKHAEVALTPTEPKIKEAEYVWKKIKESDRKMMTSSEIHQLTKGHFTNIDELKAALKTLCDKGYLYESKGVRPPGKSNRGRKPAPLYTINPDVLDWERTQKKQV